MAAVRTQFPEACPVTLRALQAPRPPAPEVLAELLANDLALLSQVLILVLDDYHLIRDPSVQTCMGRLLEVLPEICTSRWRGASIRPCRCPVSGARPVMRTARRCLAVYAGRSDRLSQAEPGLKMAPRWSARRTRTEGWIAPPPGRSMPVGPGGFHGPVPRLVAGRSQVASYLLQEVVAQQPSRPQDFLLRTAILDRLCAPLCAAVTGDGDTRAAHATLAGLSQRTPCCSRSTNREPGTAIIRCFRIHYGRPRPGACQPEQIAKLHPRAGAWYAASGFTDEAIGIRWPQGIFRPRYG